MSIIYRQYKDLYYFLSIQFATGSQLFCIVLIIALCCCYLGIFVAEIVIGKQSIKIRIVFSFCGWLHTNLYNICIYTYMFKTQFLFTTGTIYLHDCSVQNKIPILLIVIGCVDSVLFLTWIFCSCIQGDNKAPSELLNYIVGVLKIILHFFGIIPATAYVITAWQTWPSTDIVFI